MRLYLAGPMTGVPDKNRAEFFQVETHLRDLGYDVLNPHRIDELHNPTGAPREWDWYMRHTLTMMFACKGVATLPGWRWSRGASLEVDVARRLGMGVRPYMEWPQVRTNG
jgi:hypothetical protein